MKKNLRDDKTLLWKSRPMLEDAKLTSDERRRARNWHRELLQQMKENASDLADLQSNKFNRAADDLEALYESVRYPRESTLDSLCLDELESALGRQGRLFNCTDITKVWFKQPGKPVLLIPSLTGRLWVIQPGNISFSAGDEFHKPNKKHRRITPKDDNIQGTQPHEHIVKKDEMEDTQGRRLKVLEDTVARDPGEKVELFAAILDPDSFEQTVVNLFDTSFLVHQGSLGVGLNASGLPFLEKREAPTSDTPGSNHQSVVSITPTQWEELSSACDQDEPLVGHREEK